MLALVAALPCPAAGQPAALAAAAPAAELSLADAIVLGVVEGVTEFLPISSTGHLIIASRVLGLETDRPLVAPDGSPLWYRKPSAKHPHGEPLTLKLAADTYAVVIQFGAIAAVAVLYWAQLLAMVRGIFGRDAAGRSLLVNLLAAFAPTAVVGLLAHDWISANLFGVGPVIVALVAGSVLMLGVERWRRTHPPHSAELGLRGAAGIGLLQCVAMWPGTSRSMMTIVGGYLAGLDARRAAEFSFLLGFVTLGAATVFKSYKSGAAMIAVFGWPHVLLGCAVAAVTAAVCVRWLVAWLTRHGLALFAYYRLVLAGALAVMFYL